MNSAPLDIQSQEDIERINLSKTLLLLNMPDAGLL